MKAAIYCRLSEEDRGKLCPEDDSESIQNQKALLTRYAQERRWEIYDVYSDDDYAGADRNRPAWNRLLRDAQARRFDVVLCKTQSRFTRELELVEKYIHGLFPLWGVRFVSVVDGADTTLKGNKKARQINGLINEWYLEDMSENIKAVLTHKRQSGQHIGSFALYGYRKDPEQKGRLLVDQEAAAVVREVFRLFAAGHGKTAIARMLNDRGVPNPTEYKRRQGLRYRQPDSRNSTLWRYYTVSDMLRNETYIGNLVQGKYGSVSYKTRQNRPLPRSEWIRVENTHEPIIDRELWEQVQEMLAQRAKPFKEGTVGLFARKAVCMHCGYAMRSAKNRGRHYLKCATRHAAKDACAGAFLSVSALEGAVLEELRGLVEEYLDRDALAEQVRLGQDARERLNALREESAALEQKAGEYARALRELYLDKAKGVVSEADYLELSGEFQQARARLERGVQEARVRMDALEVQVESGAEQRQILQGYFHPETLTREMVEVLVDHIRIGRRDSEQGGVPVEIHWNF